MTYKVKRKTLKKVYPKGVWGISQATRGNIQMIGIVKAKNKKEAIKKSKGLVMHTGELPTKAWKYYKYKWV